MKEPGIYPSLAERICQADDVGNIDTKDQCRLSSRFRTAGELKEH